MVDAKDTGEIVTRDITLNGERFVFAVSHYKRFGEDDYSARIVWPGKVADRVVFESYVNVSGESPASSLLDGLRSLSSPDYAEKYASNIEREIAMHQQTIATLEPLVANPRPFAEEQEWREKSRESIEVNRLLAQANSDPRKHRYFRALSRLVSEDAVEQILGIDGKEGVPDVPADVWRRMFIRFRLDRRGVQNNPAAIAKRFRDVVDADTGQAAADAARAEADAARAGLGNSPIAGIAPGVITDEMIAGLTRKLTPPGFMFASPRYRKRDGRLATLRGIENKLAPKLEALQARDMFGLALADKREHAAKIAAAEKPLEKIREEISKIEKAKYQETMRGETSLLRAGPLPAQVMPGSPEWMAMDKDERLATIKRQKSVARQYLAAIKDLFNEDLGTNDNLKDVPEINSNPAEIIREIKHLVGITVRGMQPLRAGPLPAAADFVRFPAEWNSLNVPRAEMPQVPTTERPAFLQFLKDAGVKVTDEQMKPTAITPIQIEYFPAKVERAKGIPAERRVFVSADDYLLDGHHQWMAQRGRDTVNVTRIGLPVREAIATMFLFPGTEKREGGQALNAGPLPAPDPRLVKEFGENFEADEYGMPVIPKTLPDGHPLLVETVEKKTAMIPADHPLVAGLPKDHDLARGLPDDHPAFKGGFLQAGEMSRRAMRRGIVRFFMTYGAPLADDVKPIAYATGGGGGAGKSTILRILSGESRINTVGAVPVNSDDIKALIPEWNEIVKAGDGRGAATVHEESSKTAKDILGKLLTGAQKFNFIYDATLANTEKSARQFGEWKAAGYDVAMVAVTIDPQEAVVRATLRAKETGRWVPTSELFKAHAGFNRGVMELMEVADKAYTYDNTPPKPHEIAKKSPGENTISIVNQEFFEKIKLREEEIPTRQVQSRSNNRGSDQQGTRSPEGGGQGGNAADQSESSLDSARLDADYSAAVESGDMATAQRMVDEAGRNRKGVMEAIHGGVSGIESFDANRIKTQDGGAGFYFSTDVYSGHAENYAKNLENGMVYRVFLTHRNPYFSPTPYTSTPSNDKTVWKPTLESIRNLYGITDKEVKIFVDHFDGLTLNILANPWEFTYRLGLLENRDVFSEFSNKAQAGIRTMRKTLEGDFGAQNKLDLIGFLTKHDGIIYRDGSVATVLHPSQIKSADPVTRDANGNVIPLSQRFNPAKDSILYAGPLPAPDPAGDVFRYKVPVNPALVEEAKGEREGFGKNVASGKLAGFGSDRTRAEQDAIDAVYEFTKTVQKNADTMNVARQMLARDPADIERKLLDSVTDKDFNLTPADHLAIQLLIDQKTQEAGNDPAKLAENGARMMAYRIMRGDAGRLLQIGYDRYLTPAERNLAAITDAIFL